MKSTEDWLAIWTDPAHLAAIFKAEGGNIRVNTEKLKALLRCVIVETMRGCAGAVSTTAVVEYAYGLLLACAEAYEKGKETENPDVHRFTNPGDREANEAAKRLHSIFKKPTSSSGGPPPP
jgi:hypothetical protein